METRCVPHSSISRRVDLSASSSAQNAVLDQTTFPLHIIASIRRFGLTFLSRRVGQELIYSPPIFHLHTSFAPKRCLDVHENISWLTSGLFLLKKEVGLEVRESNICDMTPFIGSGFCWPPNPHLTIIATRTPLFVRHLPGDESQLALAADFHRGGVRLTAERSKLNCRAAVPARSNCSDWKPRPMKYRVPLQKQRKQAVGLDWHWCRNSTSHRLLRRLSFELDRTQTVAENSAGISIHQGEVTPYEGKRKHNCNARHSQHSVSKADWWVTCCTYADNTNNHTCSTDRY